MPSPAGRGGAEVPRPVGGEPPAGRRPRTLIATRRLGSPVSALVLVPGAWLGSWAWERVTPALRAAGHTVFPVTLPGLAEREGELTPAIGLMAHVRDVLELLVRNDLRDAILVGHSYAGAVVGGVARRAPERLRVQVYLDSLPLEEGASLIEQYAPEGRAAMYAALTSVRGARVWPMPEPLGVQAPVEGLAPSDLELLRHRGTPHPFLAFEERLAGPVSSGAPPRFAGISCVEDAPAAVAEKVEFLRGHPDWSYDALYTGHWPMLSTPRELARILDRIARS
jgi:pimeloyl-ACP methyl ester carboxylesterase